MARKSNDHDGAGNMHYGDIDTWQGYHSLRREIANVGWRISLRRWIVSRPFVICAACRRSCVPNAKPTDLNMHFGGREALKLSAVKFVRSFDAESLRRTNTAGRDAAYADSTAMHMVDLALVDFILDRRAPHIAIAAGILMLRNAGWRASSEQEEADWELKCRRLLDTVTEKVSPSKLIGQVTLEHLRHDPKLCGGAYTGVRDWTNRPWGSWHLH